MYESEGLIVQDDNTAYVVQHIKDAIEAALDEIGSVVEESAKQKVPVQTGALRDSIKHWADTGENTVMIGATKSYAPYVELGTSRMEARPFLRPAINDQKSRFEGIIAKHMQDG